MRFRRSFRYNRREMGNNLRHPVVRFVIWLAGLTAAFNVLFYLYIAESHFFETYLGWNARACASVMRAFGEGVEAGGTRMMSPRFSMEVKHGCDALQPSAFFVFAMLASPVGIPIRSRLWPIALGTAFLLLLNLVRIMTLFYSGSYFPSMFELLHIDIWQAIFIFLPLIFWIGWALRATRPASGPSNAAT